MTDIIVRVPRTEVRHFWEESPGAKSEWWTLGRRPARFTTGDLVFFALNDEIVACVFGAKHVSGKLNSDDGRVWEGEHLIWTPDRFHKFSEPLPLSRIGLKLPRGFAYVKDDFLRNYAMKMKQAATAPRVTIHPNLQLRLNRVARKLALVHRLRKIALSTEGDLIDRMAERSKKILLDVRRKFFRVSKYIEPALDEAGRAALNKAVEEIGRVVTNAGVADSAAIEENKSHLKEMWKELSKATKGNVSVMHFFNSFDRFITIAMLGSLLQNARLLERAKSDQRVRDKLYSAVEQMAQVIPQVQAILQKSMTSAKVEPPPAQEKESDPSAQEAVTNQLSKSESEMRGIVAQLARVIVDKAEELFGVGSEMADALDENIFAIYNKNKVNPQLNRNRDFYQDSLHLEHSPTHIDLGEFLDTKQKKAIYLSYRSFVMAARALGVVQHARAKPELVLKSSKLQELVIKAQEILIKRKDTIVRYLKALKKPKKEEAKDKESGIPKGTFSDFFESQQDAPSAEDLPRGMF